MITRNKKGFTLIEMLVVIAIIAVLISIAIPVITYSTNRAAAATNAANLRGVYGKLNTMKTLNPDDFNTLLTGRFHNGVVIGDSSFIGQMLNQLAVDEFATFTATNGKISLPSGIVLDALPSSRVVSYKGGFYSKDLEIEDGIEMTIVITDEQIFTFYENYTIDNFADIAEDNVLDGPVHAGIWYDLAEATCLERGFHVYETPLFHLPLERCYYCQYRKP